MLYKNINIISNLGKSLDAEEIKELLRVFDLDKVKVKIKRDENDAAIESENYGVVLDFKRSDNKAAAEGVLVLLAMQAMAEGVQGHSEFKGDLPFSLKFDFNRDKVKKTLGVANWSSPMFPIDRWNKEGYQIVVEFRDDSPAATVSSVGVQLLH